MNSFAVSTSYQSLSASHLTSARCEVSEPDRCKMQYTEPIELLASLPETREHLGSCSSHLEPLRHNKYLNCLDLITRFS